MRSITAREDSERILLKHTTAESLLAKTIKELLPSIPASSPIGPGLAKLFAEVQMETHRLRMELQELVRYEKPKPPADPPRGGSQQA